MADASESARLRPGHVAATRRGLLAAGMGGAGALLLPGLAAGAATDAGRDDAAWLVALMRVELLSLYCLDHVRSGPSAPAAVDAVLVQLRGHDSDHIAALRQALRRRGGEAPAGPVSVTAADHDLARRQVVGRLGQLQGWRDGVYLLFALERVVVGAYFVALLGVVEPALSVLLAQMMANDAQHEAVLHEQLHPGDIAGAIPYGLVQGVQ